MKQTKNNNNIKVYSNTELDIYRLFNGTSFATTIRTTFNVLKNILGKPTFKTPFGEDKVQYEWQCRFIIADRIIYATLYDYKEEHKIQPTANVEWHIGAFSKEEGEIVEQYLTELLTTNQD